MTTLNLDDIKTTAAEEAAPATVLVVSEDALAMKVADALKISDEVKTFEVGDEVWDTHTGTNGVVKEVVVVDTAMRDELIAKGLVKEGSNDADNRPGKAKENDCTVKVVDEQGSVRWYTWDGRPGKGKGRNLYHADVKCVVFVKPEQRDTTYQDALSDCLKALHDHFYAQFSGLFAAQLGHEKVALWTRALGSGIIGMNREETGLCLDEMAILYNNLIEVESLEDLEGLRFEAIMPYSVLDDEALDSVRGRAKIMGICKEKYSKLREAIAGNPMVTIDSILGAMLLGGKDVLINTLEECLDKCGRVVEDEGEEGIEDALENMPELADDAVDADALVAQEEDSDVIAMAAGSGVDDTDPTDE